MGLSSSCSIFEAFSSSLEWISINLLSASSVLHTLDDFLFIAPSKAQCERDLANFVSLCAYLSVPLTPEKTVGPDTTLQFAGIILDSKRMEARLPKEKLVKCHRLHKIGCIRTAVFNRFTQFYMSCCYPRPCFFTPLNRSYQRRSQTSSSYSPLERR